MIWQIWQTLGVIQNALQGYWTCINGSILTGIVKGSKPDFEGCSKARLSKNSKCLAACGGLSAHLAEQIVMVLVVVAAEGADRFNRYESELFFQSVRSIQVSGGPVCIKKGLEIASLNGRLRLGTAGK